MSSCKHQNLMLLKPAKSRLRCRHCHLTMTAEELGNGCCPECYDRWGKRHVDFEKLVPPENDTVRYRCEDCGAIVELTPETDRGG